MNHLVIHWFHGSFCDVKLGFESFQSNNFNSFFTILIVSLKPELFEGMRFDFTKALNQRFSLSHRYNYICIYIFSVEDAWFSLDTFLLSKEGETAMHLYCV